MPLVAAPLSSGQFEQGFINQDDAILLNKIEFHRTKQNALHVLARLSTYSVMCNVETRNSYFAAESFRLQADRRHEQEQCQAVIEQEQPYRIQASGGNVAVSLVASAADEEGPLPLAASVWRLLSGGKNTTLRRSDRADSKGSRCHRRSSRRGLLVATEREELGVRFKVE